MQLSVDDFENIKGLNHNGTNKNFFRHIYRVIRVEKQKYRIERSSNYTDEKSIETVTTTFCDKKFSWQGTDFSCFTTAISPAETNTCEKHTKRTYVDESELDFGLADSSTVNGRRGGIISSFFSLHCSLL